MQEYFFGTKELFGIELQAFDKDKWKIRLWIESKAFGSFRVKDKISQFISDIIKLLEEEIIVLDSLYETYTPAMIFEEFYLLKKSPLDFTLEDNIKIAPFRKYKFFFGEQFDATTNIIFVQNEYYHFLWSTNTNYSKPFESLDYLKNLKDAKASIPKVKETCKEFLDMFS